MGGEALKIGDSMKISIFCKRDFLDWAKISKSIKYLFIYKNISEI